MPTSLVKWSWHKWCNWATFILPVQKYHQQQQLPSLSYGCIQQQQTKYYRKIHLWDLRGKTRKCPIGTVYVCLKQNNVGKLVLFYSDVANGEAKQFWGVLVIVNGNQNFRLSSRARTVRYAC